MTLSFGQTQTSGSTTPHLSPLGRGRNGEAVPGEGFGFPTEDPSPGCYATDLSPAGRGGKCPPIRVSFVIDNLGRAGTESQLLALLRTLDRRAVQPSLVLLDGEGDASRELEPAGVPILRLGVRKLASVRAVSAAKRLRAFWLEHRPDVAQIYFLDSAYFAVPVAKACGVRKVVRVRNNLGYWVSAKHKWLGRLIRPWVDVTLTNSELGREALVTGEGLARKRVAVIENGVDLVPVSPGGEGLVWNPSPPGERGRGEGDSCEADPIPPHPQPLSPGGEGSQRIGTVANLRPVKNIAGLMRTAKSLLPEFPHLRFEVAGDGEQRAELEALHAALGLGDRFVLRGSITDVPAFLRSLDVAVLPSLSEGMSNAVLEYMAAGLPVVATAVGATPKLLDGCGVLVPAGDDTALSAALAALLRNPDRAATLGAAARRRVEAEYGRDAMRRRFEEFYRDLVGVPAVPFTSPRGAESLRNRTHSGIGFASGSPRR